MSRSTQTHLIATKHILRYVKSSLDQGISFRHSLVLLYYAVILMLIGLGVQTLVDPLPVFSFFMAQTRSLRVQPNNPQSLCLVRNLNIALWLMLVPNPFGFHMFFVSSIFLYLRPFSYFLIISALLT